MADTTFTNGITLTDADWFTDLNRLHYTIFGDPANVAAARAVMFAAVDAAGDLLQGSAADVMTRLAIGAAGTRLHSTGTAAEWQGTWFKVGSLTRDAAAATASVAYTGVGFKPKAIICLQGLSTNDLASIGADDGAARGCIYHTVGSSWATNTSNAIVYSPGGGAFHVGDIASFDADGFTVSWTKTGSPTGTMTVIYLALR